MRRPVLPSALLLSVVVLLASSSLQAQTWQWAIAGTGISNEYGAKVAVDSIGNTYVLGRFSGRIDFGATAVYGTGNSDVFLAKFDPAGGLVWATSVTGQGNEVPGDIAVDRAGNTYITGSFEGSTIVNGFVIVSTGASDIYIAKMDNLGRLLWVKTAGGPGNDDARGIALNEPGDYLYITGSFVGRALFSGDTVNSKGGSDAFLAGYSTSEGGLQWVRSSGGPGYDAGIGVGVDKMNYVYETGIFTDSAAFFNNQFVSLPGSDSGAVFVAKHDVAGIPRFVLPGTTVDRNLGPVVSAIDIEGNIYVSSTFRDSLLFGTTWLHSAGGTDIYMIRWNAFGGVRWAVTMGDTLNEYVLGLAADQFGNVFMTGSTADTNGLTIDTVHVENAFVAKFLPANTLEWIRTSEGNAIQRGLDVGVDRRGNTYVTGLFTGTMYLDENRLSTSATNSDMFLARVGPNATVTTDSILGTPLCAGTTLLLRYRIGGSFYSNNLFTAQLSDSSGSFARPVVIGQVAATGAGTINATIPASTPSGSNYRIRVIGTSPEVTGADNGDSIQIIAMPRPKLQVQGNDTICAGGSTTLDAGDWAAYHWSTGATSRTITVSAPGRYWATVTNANACMGRSDTVTVVVGPIPAKPAITVSGALLEADDAATWQWYLDGNPIPNATRRRWVAVQTGRYSVRVTNIFGCEAMSDAVYVEVAGIDVASDPAAISLRHVRAAEHLELTVQRPGTVRALLVDVAGRIVADQSSSGGGTVQRITIPLGDLPTGTYFVRIDAADRVWTSRIVLP